MKIDDNWFTKTMITNTLSRTDKIQSQTGSTNIGIENPFARIFAELLTQMEENISGQPTVTSNFTNLITTADYFDNNNQNKVINSDETLQFQPRNADSLNQGLAGALAGQGDTFIRAGKLYNLDPALLTAIAKHESGNGKSKAANIKNNIAGMMGRSGLKSYASIEDSIMDMARNLNKNYLGKGLTSIAEIGAKYAPVGAANDPTGLNNHWVNGVTIYFNQLSGSNNDIVSSITRV